MYTDRIAGISTLILMTGTDEAGKTRAVEGYDGVLCAFAGAVGVLGLEKVEAAEESRAGGCLGCFGVKKYFVRRATGDWRWGLELMGTQMRYAR